MFDPSKHERIDELRQEAADTARDIRIIMTNLGQLASSVVTTEDLMPGTSGIALAAMFGVVSDGMTSLIALTNEFCRLMTLDMDEEDDTALVMIATSARQALTDEQRELVDVLYATTNRLFGQGKRRMALWNEVNGYDRKED